MRVMHDAVEIPSASVGSPQRRSDVALTDAGRFQHENIFVLRDPNGFLRQRADDAFVQSTRRAVIDIFPANIAVAVGLVIFIDAEDSLPVGRKVRMLLP